MFIFITLIALNQTAWRKNQSPIMFRRGNVELVYLILRVFNLIVFGAPLYVSTQGADTML